MRHTYFAPSVNCFEHKKYFPSEQGKREGHSHVVTTLNSFMFWLSWKVLHKLNVILPWQSKHPKHYLLPQTVLLQAHLNETETGTNQVETHFSLTLLLTRPNFLRVQLSFTPPWIFNYTDKELEKQFSPSSLFPPCLTARLRFLTCPTWEPHLSPRT